MVRIPCKLKSVELLFIWLWKVPQNNFLYICEVNINRRYIYTHFYLFSLTSHFRVTPKRWMYTSQVVHTSFPINVKQRKSITISHFWKWGLVQQQDFSAATWRSWVQTLETITLLGGKVALTPKTLQWRELHHALGLPLYKHLQRNVFTLKVILNDKVILNKRIITNKTLCK